MKDNELRRMIEESVNAVLMLEKQMEDIRKQMQILQALINELKPNDNGVMARNLFYSKSTGMYNDWHRNIQDDTFKQLDIDVVEYSECKLCKKKHIHFIAETCYYKGNLYKNTEITRMVSQMMGVTAYLIFYQPVNSNIKTTDAQIMELGYDPNLSFHIAEISTLKSNYGYKFKTYSAYEWVMFLKNLRTGYKCNSLECTKWRK
jgi:hypothetical protein